MLGVRRSGVKCLGQKERETEMVSELKTSKSPSPCTQLLQADVVLQAAAVAAILATASPVCDLSSLSVPEN